MKEEVTISIWHPINGEFIHLMQIDRNGVREFYTSGVFVGLHEIDENGLLKKDHEFNRPDWVVKLDEKLAQYEHYEEVVGEVVSINGKDII